MSLNWTSKLVKYLLFGFNLLFVITGIILIALGVSVKAYYREYEFFLDKNYFSAPNFLIAIGAIIFFIAFFGCCGAMKENFCMIVAFSSLLILVFVLEFSAGISGYLMKNHTEDFLTLRMDEAIKEYGNDTASTKMWDIVQQNFQCCGVKNYTDWINEIKYIPWSCCPSQDRYNVSMNCTEKSFDLYQNNCLASFGDFVKEHVVTIGSVGLALAFIQLLGIIFSCHLSKQIKRSYLAF